MKRNGGFTLVELVVVIVILGILAGIAAPKFFEVKGEARNSEMKALASSINKSIEMVSAKAMLENKASSPLNTIFFGGEDIQISVGYPLVTLANIRKMLAQMSPTIQSQGKNPLLLYPADNTLRDVTNVSKTNLPDGCYVAVWGTIFSGDDIIPPVAKAPANMKCI